MTIFREYDVRGIADQHLPDNVAWALGRSLADLAKHAGETGVYIGQDVRLSSPRLARALACGFQDAGISVRMLPPGPTPLTYFAAAEQLGSFVTKSGVMVTGSHNPPEYNGFKMVIGGRTLFGDDIQKLRTSVEQYLPLAHKKIPPHFFEVLDRRADYVSYVKNNISMKRPLRVVVDAGNGAAGELALATYEALGCETIGLFCEADGTFPNHHPDPTVPNNLKDLIAAVKEHQADLGIGFDGDGDRIGAVSAQGKILYGDHLVAYFARDILKDCPGATIISEVKSSQFLYDKLKEWGAHPIMWKTGHSLIKSKLKETNGALAGEMSGHMFFAHRFFGFDDAIYAGARLMEGLASRTETLDEFLESLPHMTNTPELRVDCPDEIKFDVVRQFVSAAKTRYGSAVNDIDGARVAMHGGWGLVRASNTQPILVMRFEAPDRSRLITIRNEFQTLINEIGATLEVPEIV